MVSAAFALALAACGKEKSPEQQRQEAVAQMQDTAGRLKNLSSDPDKAAAELQALGKDMEERLARAKAGEGGAVVDACAFLDEADVLALIGAAATREPMPRMGSSWGGCNYGPAEMTLENMGASRYLMVNIRPANEFDGTVDYHRQGGAVAEVPGLDGKAYVDGKSLLWQPPGKPWFVFVSGGPMGKQDPRFAVDAARRMKL
ncbi:hypothetical protein B1992_02460 [Pseudoxanthomonas broegbernensis]|uniref:Uncharacterized protein n=2 Tax=Pseudoxanthomonas broegbernensis TaxID=83619 RepID=A0A7V8GPC3_9GAMM|nr:hypothetical protein B1992_02460 [Pseudoxanthomonas broegbernensis]